MNIRGGRPEDLGAMVALERQSPTAAHWPKSFYGRLFEDGAPARISLVADEDDLLQGFLIARMVGDECELESIVVAEASRRCGLGKNLIHALIDTVSDRKATRIFLEVRESNAVARAFYETCGFSSAGSRESYYSDPAEDAVLYILALENRAL